MPTYDLTGTVKTVLDQKTFDSGFTKREFVVTTEDDKFPQEIIFECVKDRVALLDNVTPGQRLKVTFDLRGNEYKGRWFVNLTAWRLEPADGAADASFDAGPPVDQLEPPAEEDVDDMPF